MQALHGRVTRQFQLLADQAFSRTAGAPLVGGNSSSPIGAPLIAQGVAALVAGILALGFGQLIAVNQRVADNMDNLLDYIRSQDRDTAPAAGSSRDVFANVPDYSPRRDPPIVKEGTYREHTVLTLEDGTVAVQTQSGWKRFRRIRDFERVLNARFPTVTDVQLSPLRRSLLRAASAWRYRLGVYAHPLELRALLKLCTYRRAETIGF